ncbi:Pex19 protein family-domain-containing protein [Mycena floridula]|nr:Pex19 protein family-domain-containing protein [Mycena floridula]
MSFLSSPPPPPPTATTTTSFGRPRTNTRVDQPPKSVPGSGLDTTVEDNGEELNAEFAKELAKGMENLMKELVRESKDEPGATDDDEAKRALKAWETMLIASMNEMGPLDQAAPQEASDPNDFQGKIQDTLKRLRENESNLKGDQPASSSDDPDSLQALLSALSDLNVDGSGGDSEEDMAGVLEGVMSQLMSKEILYDPLKELADKFPAFLANPPAPLEASERTRYESQLTCVRKILAVFDDPEYDEANPVTVEKTVNLMSEMQTYGSPPEAVTGPIPGGLPAGLDSNECIIA